MKPKVNHLKEVYKPFKLRKAKDTENRERKKKGQYYRTLPPIFPPKKLNKSMDNFTPKTKKEIDKFLKTEEPLKPTAH